MYSRIESLNLISAISVSPIYSLLDYAASIIKNAAVSSRAILPHRNLLCKTKETACFLWWFLLWIFLKK